MAGAPAHVPEDLIVDFDVYDDRLAVDFNHCTDDLPPVSYTVANGGHWILKGFEPIMEVLRNPDRFSSLNQSIPPELGQGRGRFIPLEYDPPEHTEYRQLLVASFSPPRMQKLEPRLRELTRNLLEEFAGKGECEFMSAFARPLPAIMFLGLMGWPIDRLDEFCSWVDGFLYGGGGSSDSEEGKEIRAAAIANCQEYFRSFVLEARKDPQDDITGTLLAGRMRDGRPLTEQEILDYIFILLIAGLHTVEGTLAFSVRWFSEYPEERQRLIDNPSLLPTAIEELLRWEPPAWGTVRVVKEEGDIFGVHMMPGDKILLPHQTANRDASVYDHPQEFDMARTPNPHVSFGGGAHKCLGMHLARQELKVALEELHAMIPDYRVDTSHPVVEHMGQVRGVESLYLRFTPYKGR